jgi:hypothetical protein
MEPVTKESQGMEPAHAIVDGPQVHHHPVIAVLVDIMDQAALVFVRTATMDYATVVFQEMETVSVKQDGQTMEPEVIVQFAAVDMFWLDLHVKHAIQHVPHAVEVLLITVSLVPQT